MFHLYHAFIPNGGPKQFSPFSFPPFSPQEMKGSSISALAAFRKDTIEDDKCKCRATKLICLSHCCDHVVPKAAEILDFAIFTLETVASSYSCQMSSDVLKRTAVIWGQTEGKIPLGKTLPLDLPQRTEGQSASPASAISFDYVPPSLYCIGVGPPIPLGQIWKGRCSSRAAAQ